MQLGCPKCGGDNTQKLSLAVQGSTFNNETTTVGVGGGSGGLGLLGATSKGKSASKTAEKYAEPEKAPAISGSLGILILAWFCSLYFGEVAMTVGFWIGAAVLVLGLLNNWFLFPREHAEWDAKFICLRCENVFTPGAKEESSDDE